MCVCVCVCRSEMAETVFDASMKLLERVFCEVVNDFGGNETTIALTLHAPENRKGVLQVFAERVGADEELGRTDHMSKDELIERLNTRYGVTNVDDADWGTLATRYDECEAAAIKVIVIVNTLQSLSSIVSSD